MPPNSAREPILLTNTSLSSIAFFIRTRSPKNDPPVIGLEGSIAITPTDNLLSLNIGISIFINELLPDPGGPVIPIFIALRESLKICLDISRLENFPVSIPVISSEIDIKSFFFAFSNIFSKVFKATY